MDLGAQSGWPLLARVRDDGAVIGVRQHENGRRIVYGLNTADAGIHTGALMCDEAHTVDAVVDVGSRIGRADLADRVLAQIPTTSNVLPFTPRS